MKTAFPQYNLQICTQKSNFHVSRSISKDFDAFMDPPKKPNEVMQVGRAWTMADLRRKSFEDLHKLWFVMYKERNLLLTSRNKSRKMSRPVVGVDEKRYLKIKVSMGAIKKLLMERSKIKKIIAEKEKVAQEAAAAKAAESKADS